MFGVEYSKDNFTLLRFTKSQLGLDEHVCVYRGSKGEHTVSFFLVRRAEVIHDSGYRACKRNLALC